MQVTTRVRRAIDRIVSEPALVLATVVAAVNSTGAGEQTWQGYAAAIGIALLRFAVSPAKDRRDKQPDRSSPEFDQPPFPVSD